MLVYGDRARQVVPQQALAGIRGELNEAFVMQRGVCRHAALVDAFLTAAGLAQGVADAEFQALGVDELSPQQDAAMDLMMALGRCVASSWRSGFAEPGALPESELARLGALGLPAAVTVKEPEGHAFYAVYLEAWLEAGARLVGGAPTVIGLRSIGVGLAAMAAVGAGAERPLTLRPCGPPFRRELRLGPRLRERLLSAPERGYAIADEGPGLSGSSFGAVADVLEDAGVPPERILFMPSHSGAPGPEASVRHRERWENARKHQVAFEDLLLASENPAHRLPSWFEDLTGRCIGPTEDLSGGGWRRLRAGRPPAYPGQERRKFLLSTATGQWLLKFAGLGSAGREKLAMAKALAAAGFTAEPLGLRHGFIAERWLNEAKPLNLAAAERGRLATWVGWYLGFRSRALPATTAGAGPDELAQMVRVNAGELLGESAGERLAHVFAGLMASAEPPRPVMIDGRLHVWEWLRLPDGRLIKTDAVDHAQAHDLVGPQDIAWDVAGAIVEFKLSDRGAQTLCAAIEESAGRAPDRRLIEAMLVAYPAFQAGLWSFALAAASAEDRPQIAELVRRYADRLVQALDGAAARPAAARSA